MAGLFVGLGVWQLARNTHKHDLVAREKAAYGKPAPDVTALPANARDGARVEARGRFDAARETVLRNRVRTNKVGIDVLTPLRLADGSAVVVDRGWVRASASGVTAGSPPTGTAVVRGLLHTSSRFAAGETVDRLADGHLAVPRVDLRAIGATFPYRLRPVWIEAQAIEPPPARNAPALPQPPSPDSVNHLEYAIEWFAFALIPILGWPIALRRLLRQRNADTNASSDNKASTEPVTSRSGRVGSRDSTP
jgi:cytochrome oxidase assembly protein ShyY1